MAIKITMPDATKTYDVKGKRKMEDATISGMSGIYVFKDSEDRVLYVGKSKDLNNRINQHLRTVPYPFDNRASSVTVYVETDPTSVDIYESFMITELKPEYNKAGMYAPEFQRQNAEELFELEVNLSEAEDERRVLRDFIARQEDDIMDDESLDASELIEAIRDLGRVKKKIAELKREIGLRKRRAYKEVS